MMGSPWLRGASASLRVGEDLGAAHLVGIFGEGVELRLERLERALPVRQLGELLLGLGDRVDDEDL